MMRITIPGAAGWAAAVLGIALAALFSRNGASRSVAIAAVVLGIAFAAVFAGCDGRPDEFGAPVNLRVEYEAEALGIDALVPRLSWEVNDARRGAVQSAYRILVAENARELRRLRGTVWDSGKVRSDRSVHVEYGGPPLASRERYYWIVQTWDGNDRASGFSEPAWWEMGLLEDADWEGAWIGYWAGHERTGPGAAAPGDGEAQAAARATDDVGTQAGADAPEDLEAQAGAIEREAGQVPAYAGEEDADPPIDDGQDGESTAPDSALFAFPRLVEDFVPPRSVQLRKEFATSGEIVRARAYATGLGAYVLYLNGERVGSDLLAPGWTHYPDRLQYQTYDVTALLRDGPNAAGVRLGNGWYASGLGWDGPHVYGEGPLRFRMTLFVEYEDGRIDVVATDGTWRASASPIVENTIYHGETYDARLEEDGWSEPGFDDRAWNPVATLDHPPVTLVAQQIPPIRVTEEITPVSITEVAPDTFVADMGRNMVGRVRLTVSGERGDTVRLRFAETLRDDGRIYTENLRTARATDTYVLHGGGEETWAPEFTYHGFRYVEITGFSGTPQPAAVIGEVFHNDLEITGRFTSSNGLLNRIWEAILWSQRGNLHDVPTDCPQRDERLGWMGDAQAYAPTAAYNMDMARFFAKWVRDMVDGQDPAGFIHDVNPPVVVTGPGKPGWGDAIVTVPWVVHRFYGDARIIEENYDAMTRWVDYLTRHAEDDLYVWSNEAGTWFGYGDWVAVEETPARPIGAAYHFYSARLLSEMARVIGRGDDAARYGALAERIAGAYHRAYYDAEAGSYEGGTQTANLIPLAFGIVPEHLEETVFNAIVSDVVARDTHLTTGFLGTPLILPELSDRGHHELAYALATRTTYPSWGYMIEQGATTIWELWDSDVAGPSMNSRNHFALGSAGEWFFSHLAGIRPDSAGFKRSFVAPMPAGDLGEAAAELRTVYGLLSSAWERSDEAFVHRVTIPPNTSAVVRLPLLGLEAPTITEGDVVVLEDGRAPGPAVTLTPHFAELRVGAGTYEFVVR